MAECVFPETGFGIENLIDPRYQDLLHMPDPEAQVLNWKIAWIEETGLRMPDQQRFRSLV